MRLTRLTTTFLFLTVLTVSASAQFEKEAGKLIFKNAFLPYPAGNDKVAFVRLDEKIPGMPMELYLGEIATGKESRLLPGFDLRMSPSPCFAFSPSGTEFVVPTKGGNGAWELMKYTVGSKTGTQIGDLSQFKEIPSPEALKALNLDLTALVKISDLSWSPSGKRLIFSMVRLDNSSVWWIDIATGRARQATEDKVGYYGSLHPNDDLFCYTDNIVYEGISTDQGIILRSLTTGKADTLVNTRDNESAGQISPDGRYMVYNRLIQDSNNVWVINIATRETRALTKVTGGIKQCAYPRWSPDGKKIYFQANGFLEQSAVFMRDFTPF